MGFLKKGKRAVNTPFCSCVVPAAGSSRRMGSDKITAELLGKPVILRTLEALEQSPYIQEIILVTRQESLTTLAGLCYENGLKKVTKVMLGGESRLESVLLGVNQASGKAKLIAIHDGARPLVSQQVIRQAVMAADKYRSAAPALPMKDTVKAVDQQERVTATVERATLRAVQTPQVFDADLIRGALQKAMEENAPVTDDCSAVERLGFPVYLTQGEEKNLKLTTPFDFLVAEAILRQESCEEGSE